jgi:CNT family concentrative nucleoside transporter
MGLLGVIFVLAAAYGLSVNRKAIRWPVLAWGLGLQLALAILILRTPFEVVFQKIGDAVNRVMEHGQQGAIFVFGDLAKSDGPLGVSLAFQILPLIIFVSSLFAVLYYLGLMQWVVRAIAVVMQRAIGTSGAESLNIAANVFMGQNEAPLTIRPYLARLTESELMAVMTGGMATISGALLVAYVRIAGIAIEHLLTASIMVAPACLMLAKIIIPETGQPETYGRVPSDANQGDVNLVAAIARGALEGLQLALAVGAVLVVFFGLMTLLNGLLSAVRDATGMSWLPKGLEDVLEVVFAPISWLLGVPWKDAPAVGNLLGTRMVLNEFVSYVRLGEIRQNLEPRSFIIAGYALCGFANFGSIGVQVAGLGSLIPERRNDMARLGLRAMLAATLANFLTAAIAGLLIA